MSNNINTNFNNNNVTNPVNTNNYSSNQNLATNNNLNILTNLTNESQLFEVFSTYKIISLELISIFCNIKVINTLF
jgi:hypothetical protein